MKRYAGLLDIRAESITYKPFHVNSNLRLLYVLEGSINCRWVAGVHSIHEGEIEILNINEPVCIEKSGEENLVLIFEIDAGKAKEFYSFIDKALYNCNTTLFYPSRADSDDQALLKEKVRTLYHYYVGEMNDFLLEKVVEEIVIHIRQRFHDLNNMFTGQKGSDARAERFFRIYTYIYENYDKKINLKELAEKEYVSQQYLSKEFNDRLNMNFKDTLEYYRVINSVRYLITTKKTVTMISELCGFSASRYFYKHFFLYLKCTPKEFRDKYLSLKEECKPITVNNDLILTCLHQFEEDEERFSKVQEQKKESYESVTILEAENYIGPYSRRKISKETIQKLLGAARNYLTADTEVLEAGTNAARERLSKIIYGEKAETAPAVFVFYLKTPEITSLKQFILQAERTAVCAYRMGVDCREEGLAFSLVNDILDDAEVIRSILELTETDFPLIAVTAGYPA